MAEKQNRLSSIDRRRQIIQVAMKLFAKQGFQGTTTRQIAESARVNEAILFRHFPHKEDLYWAVLESKCQGARIRRELRNTLRDSDSAEEALAAVAASILRRNVEDPTRSRLFLFSALENHRLSHRLFRAHLVQYYDMVADYIRKQIRRGEFRPMDARLAARGFLGMVVHHLQIQELFGGKRYQKFDPRRASETMASIWLHGMDIKNGNSLRPKTSLRRR
jgi:AcrR family transcriptional regulator